MNPFAKLYPLEILKQMIVADEELSDISVEKILLIATTLNEYEIGRPPFLPLFSKNEIAQEVSAQMQNADIDEEVEQEITQLLKQKKK